MVKNQWYVLARRSSKEPDVIISAMTASFWEDPLRRPRLYSWPEKGKGHAIINDKTSRILRKECQQGTPKESPYEGESLALVPQSWGVKDGALVTKKKDQVPAICRNEMSALASASE